MENGSACGSPSQLAVDAAYNLMPHKLFENQFYAAVVVSSETENVIKADIVEEFHFSATGSSGRLWPEAERQKNLSALYVPQKALQLEK